MDEDQLEYWESHLSFQVNPELSFDEEENDSEDSDYYGLEGSQESESEEVEIESQKKAKPSGRQPPVVSTSAVSVPASSSRRTKRSFAEHILGAPSQDSPQSQPSPPPEKPKSLKRKEREIPSKKAPLLSSSDSEESDTNQFVDTDSDDEQDNNEEEEEEEEDDDDEVYKEMSFDRNDYGEDYDSLMRDLLRQPGLDDDGDESDDESELTSLQRAIQSAMIGAGKKAMVASASDLKLNAVMNGIFPEKPRERRHNAGPSKRGSFKERLQSLDSRDSSSSPPHKFSKISFEDSRPPRSSKGKHQKAMSYAREYDSPLLKYDRLIRKFINNPHQLEYHPLFLSLLLCTPSHSSSSSSSLLGSHFLPPCSRRRRGLRFTSLPRPTSC